MQRAISSGCFTPHQTLYVIILNRYICAVRRSNDSVCWSGVGGLRAQSTIPMYKTSSRRLFGPRKSSNAFRVSSLGWKRTQADQVTCIRRRRVIKPIVGGAGENVQATAREPRSCASRRAVCEAAARLAQVQPNDGAMTSVLTPRDDARARGSVRHKIGARTSSCISPGIMQIVRRRFFLFSCSLSVIVSPRAKLKQNRARTHSSPSDALLERQWKGWLVSDLSSPDVGT
jgi:hypothetical protein